MRILFASGKGGAGKTTVTASLAKVWPREAIVVDADVEAPNVALFTDTTIESKTPVAMRVPEKITDRCDFCGECIAICQFKAVVKLGDRIVAFPDMCHGCGGCFTVCTRNAIKEGERALGEIVQGKAFDGQHSFLAGRSRIGESMTPPLIRALNQRLKTIVDDRDVLIDAPPGVSCPVMTASRMADLVVLIAEPTPFGFHDFRLAVQAFKESDKPMAVILNRSGQANTQAIESEIAHFCETEKLWLIDAIPFAEEAAKHYARSGLLCDLNEQWHERFVEIAHRLCALDAKENTYA